MQTSELHGLVPRQSLKCYYRNNFSATTLSKTCVRWDIAKIDYTGIVVLRC